MRRILSGLLAVILICSNMNIQALASAGIPAATGETVECTSMAESETGSTESVEETISELTTEDELGSEAETTADEARFEAETSAVETESENEISTTEEPENVETETVAEPDTVTESETIIETEATELTTEETTEEPIENTGVSVASTTQTYLTDNTAPYDGNYVLIANTNTSVYGGFESTGTLPEKNVTAANNLLETQDAVFSGVGNNICDIDKYGIPIVDPASVLRNSETEEILSAAETAAYYKALESNESVNYAVGDIRVYYLNLGNLDEDYYETVYDATDCVCVAVSEYCTVWVPVSDPIYRSNASRMKNYMSKLATEFDKQFPKMTEAFGSKETADMMGDNDGKTALVCYDIEGDRYNTMSSYMAGYFYSADLNLPNTSYVTGSNSDCLHIDSYNAMRRNESDRTLDVTNVYGTMVHELQHMINYSACRDHEENYNVIRMPSYLDEAFSEAAAHLCYGARTSRISYYNSETDIATGSRSLIDWPSWDTLGNYSLSYLFSQYIRTQYVDGEKIYKDALDELSEDNSDMLEIIADKLNMTSNELLLNYRAALFLKNAEGKYGFKGERWAESIKSLYTTISTEKTIRPGAAMVVQSAGNFTPFGQGENIDFLGMYTNKTIENVKVSIDGDMHYITTNKGQVQLSTEVTPVNVSQDVIYSIPDMEDRMKVSVTTDGLVTAIGDGEVTVRATSVYSPSKYDEVTIVISGQQQVDVELNVQDVYGGKQISCTVKEPSDVTLYYTLDGELPTTESSGVPDDGILLDEEGTHTVAVLAVDNEDVYNIRYIKETYTVDKVPDPVISVTEDAGPTTYQTISISAEEGTDIYYTTNGTTPTIETAIKYEEPFSLMELGKYTIKVITVRAGYANSNCVEKVVVVRDRIQELTLSDTTFHLYTNMDGQPDAIQLSYAYSPLTADTEYITWASDNEEVVAVDRTGYVTAVGEGSATITAVADGVSTSCVVNVHTRAEELVITNSRLAITKNLGTLQMKVETLPAVATNRAFTYTVEPSDRQEDESGLAFISSKGLLTAAKNGVVKVTIRNEDVPGTIDTAVEKVVYVTISNQKSYQKEYCPKFSTTSLSINKLETTGKAITILPLYEYSISGVKVDENYEYASCFAIAKAEGEYDWTISLTETGKQVLGNKSYKVPVIVSSNEDFTQMLTVKVSGKAPAVTLNKITVNPAYPNKTYALTAKSKMGAVSILGIKDGTKAAGFTENFTFDAMTGTIALARPYEEFVKNVKGKPVVAGKVIVQVDGYEPQEATITVKVQNKAPKLETQVKTYNMNYTKLNEDLHIVVDIRNVISSKVKNDLTTISSVRLNDGAGKSYTKVKELVEVDVDEDGVWIGFVGENVAAGTYTIPLLISSTDAENPETDFTDVKCNVKIVVKKETQLPKLTLQSKSVKLNKQLVGEIATIGIKAIDQSNVELIDFSIEVAEPKQNSNVDEAVELRYNEYTGQLEAELTDSEPGCNKYIFKCTPVYVGINEEDVTLISPIPVTVSLINKAPAVSVKANGSIDPLNRESSEIVYTIKKSNFTDAVDFVEMIEPVKTSATILNGIEYFEEPVLNDDGTLTLKARTDVVFTKKCKYAFRLEMTMANCGETVVTKDIIVTPKQATVKLTASTKPVFYNRVQVMHNIVQVTLSVNKGEISNIVFRKEANKKLPDAFGVEIDSNGQLETITYDGTAGVKKGTYTIALDVYYEGQMWEAGTSKRESYEKPVTYKIKVTVK